MRKAKHNLKYLLVFKNLYIYFQKFLINLKTRLVSRLFWGRGNYYRNFYHVSMLIVTILIATSGLLARISAQATGIFNQSSAFGSNDLLEQGGSIETVITLDPKYVGINIQYHTVEKNETLESISNKYNVTVDTIRWANPGVLSPFTNYVEPGWELAVPNINGVLYNVRAGQTVADIARETGGNEFDITEFNEITSPNNLTAGEHLFVPDGNLYRPDINVEGIPYGVFINPLSHPDCNGYIISRGFLSYHNGVDMALLRGCPIEAVANGVVVYAGWLNAGEGYNVKIDHGGGILTEYFHGNGTIWVKAGQRVQQGQPLLQMGCTGFCTGPHLHFILRKNNVAVDPAPYVPL